jgi:UDP-N-acetylglucosamine 2-epimerase (non-hydrolysing)
MNAAEAIREPGLSAAESSGPEAGPKLHLQPDDRPGPILCVVGARPNYMKMAPLVHAFREHGGLPRVVLVHTGQHYDVDMNERLFSALEMPPPEVNLEVGSATHAVQTAEIMKRFEPVVDELDPSCVIVVGDVNSTLACSLVATKKGIPVVHVEAGLRSYDRTMPEEVNRVLTDQLADVLYTTERSAADNLSREGVDRARIRFVGNVMIDSLLRFRSRAMDPAETMRQAGLPESWVEAAAGFGVVTLHRPSNVDDSDSLATILGVLCEASRRLPLLWPVHPRTRANIERFALMPLLTQSTIALLPPQGYLEMLGLQANARVVLTDSGGMQEETTALGVPCLTLRENTERPITVSEGTNRVVGRDHAEILRAIDEIMDTGGKRGRVPELWDGHAAERIAEDLAAWLSARVQ